MKSIIDEEVIESYAKKTGKQWTEIEEHMAEICSFYEYGFEWNEKGNIIINSDLNEEISYEYDTAADMVNDWMALCKESNIDYIKNGMDAPFKWCI